MLFQTHIWEIKVKRYSDFQRMAAEESREREEPWFTVVQPLSATSPYHLHRGLINWLMDWPLQGRDGFRLTIKIITVTKSTDSFIAAANV